MPIAIQDTIDITDFIEKARQTFVIWAVDYVFAQAMLIPGLQWMALPVVSSLIKLIIERIAIVLSKAAVMQAFFMNTVLRKSSQAKDYIDAVNSKLELPDTATDAEYERAERHEIDAFNSFVILGD